MKNPIFKKVIDAVQSYASRAFLFLILLILVLFYEITLNSISNKDSLPIIALTGTGILNVLVYWFKLYLLLFIPFTVFYFISKKLANIFYSFTAILLLIIQLGLVQYFTKTFVPLGADLFAYSVADIKQTIAAAGGIEFSVIISLLLAIALFVFVFYRFSKMVNLHRYFNLAFIVLSFSILLSGFNYSGSDSSLKTEYEQSIAKHKSDFFITQSYRYFFPEILETDIYSDIYSGDFGNNAISIRDFAYVDEGRYPFLHKDETPDVLSPFFNPGTAKPNIVILLVEGLGRAFTNEGAVLGNFTPFFDSLSKQSLYWKNFLSSGGRSFAVLPSVLGSLPFAKNGFNELAEKMPDHLSLLSLARHNGYSTSFYYGGNSSFDNMNIFLKKNAINNIYDETSFPAGYSKLPSKNGFSWGYGDNELFRRYLSVQKVDSIQPQLNVLFTVSTHSPFLINDQQKFDDRFEKRLDELGFSEDKKSLYRQYKSQYASVLFFDDALKTFFEKYKQRNDFNNTIFIITGDHRLPEIPMITKMDRYHVPMVIYSPMLNRTASFSSVSSHFDIAPSMLAFLENAYGFKKPGLASWIGSGLDTTRIFSNNHQYPLMQTKNDVIDFVQGNFHLNAENVFALTSTMDEEPIQDKDKYQQLLGSFNQFKNRNTKLINGAKLIPDTIYQKYFPR